MGHTIFTGELILAKSEKLIELIKCAMETQDSDLQKNIPDDGSVVKFKVFENIPLKEMVGRYSFTPAPVYSSLFTVTIPVYSSQFTVRSYSYRRMYVICTYVFSDWKRKSLECIIELN